MGPVEKGLKKGIFCGVAWLASPLTTVFNSGIINVSCIWLWRFSCRVVTNCQLSPKFTRWKSNNCRLVFLSANTWLSITGLCEIIHFYNCPPFWSCFTRNFLATTHYMKSRLNTWATKVKWKFFLEGNKGAWVMFYENVPLITSKF